MVLCTRIVKKCGCFFVLKKYFIFIEICKAILKGILLGVVGVHEVDENGFEVDEFGNPID